MTKINFTYDLPELVKSILRMKASGYENPCITPAVYKTLDVISDEDLYTILDKWSKETDGRTNLFSNDRDAHILLSFLCETPFYKEAYGEYLCAGYLGPGVYDKKTQLFHALDEQGWHSVYPTHYLALINILKRSDRNIHDEAMRWMKYEIDDSPLLNAYISEHIVFVLSDRTQNPKSIADCTVR